jgi:hypothetical protein
MTNDSKPIPLHERLKPFMKNTFTLPKPWIGLILVLLVISTLQFTDSGGFEGIEITTWTLLLLLVMWAPTAVKMLTVSGGTVRAGKGEATFKGLVSVITDYVAMIEQKRHHMNLSEQESERVDQLFLSSEQIVASSLRDSREAHSKLEKLATQYEQIREEPRTDDRTFRLEKIVAEIRAYASLVDLDTDDLRDLLSGSEGDRIIALGILQRIPRTSLFELLLEAIRVSPNSGFEQYHALLAVKEMLPDLNATQKASLQDLLTKKLNDENSHIAQSSDRTALSRQILSALDEP